MTDQQLVKAGDHVARIIDYGVTATQKGDPMVVVKFQTEEGNVFWNGVLKEAEAGKRNIPIEGLITMGLKSINDIENIADGPASGVLNIEQEVRVSVVHEEYNGKWRAKVNFVNPLAGGGKFKNAMEKQDLKVKLAGMAGLRGDFAAAWQQASGKTAPTATAKPNGPASASMEDIPF